MPPHKKKSSAKSLDQLSAESVDMTIDGKEYAVSPITVGELVATGSSKVRTAALHA